ncbi:MAG: aspartate aminotransferase family protein [Rhodoglobus sp.]
MAGPTTYFDPSTAGSLPERTRHLVERRARAMGSAYRLFYQEPIEFVRGSGTKLYDADGNEYLDVYNNVPSVGHAHPRVAEAMAKQAATLTTHTRYLAEPTIAYAEDLLSTFPVGIDNVMFTCTGSEANDLALRIAKYATGGTGVIVTKNAYHGITTEIAAISPSLGGIESLPAWTKVVDAPHGEDLGVAVVTALFELLEAGIRPAALIVDTIFASDGVYPNVPGLNHAVAAVRAAGGLFIADEVQPGFGRLGRTMWGFERYDLVPDIVTVGKPMGNGQPIAAVMASHGLIDQFNSHSRYFNTFGGSSVSIAAAQATLDVLRDEKLQKNARKVGRYLRDQLATLGDFEEVRGAGLFIGAKLESEERALAVVNALRERRVLVAASGAANDTLKIRPPLPFSYEDADRLLTELAAVLR